MNHALRTLFFALIVRPFMIIVLGTNLQRGELLPERGPAIIVANHNSHLDVFALMNVLGLHRLPHVRPVAAADYFLTRPLRRWFSTRIVGIIPIDRKQTRRDKDGKHPLEPISSALAAGDIVLLFPEGSRGQPEQLAALQSGVAHLARRHPDVPITPVFMHGLGKALPKGEAILVPFFCDMFVGEPLPSGLSKKEFMQQMDQSMKASPPNCPPAHGSTKGFPAIDRIDLLSVVMHELGHVLGHDHLEDGLMSDTLATSVRADLDAFFASLD